MVGFDSGLVSVDCSQRKSRFREQGCKVYKSPTLNLFIDTYATYDFILYALPMSSQCSLAPDQDIVRGLEMSDRSSVRTGNVFPRLAGSSHDTNLNLGGTVGLKIRRSLRVWVGDAKRDVVQVLYCGSAPWALRSRLAPTPVACFHCPSINLCDHNCAR